MEIVHSGFDTLDVAFMGALSERSRRRLSDAKERAKGEGMPVEFSFGKISGMVAPKGTQAQQGYAYIFDTGPDGEIWTFKDNGEPSEWNIRVSVRAARIAIDGLAATEKRLWETLETMGAKVLEESISRIDYAVDIVAPDFVLDPDCVIAHNRCLIDCHDGGEWTQKRRARRWETVTVGKMPGRQVTIYDKRREVMNGNKVHWFEIWQTSREECPQIWRVEVRAGKDHLKDWNITSFADLRARMGDMFNDAMASVRLLERSPVDGENVSRVKQAELWHVASVAISKAVRDHVSGASRGRIRVERRKVVEIGYLRQLRGLAIGYAVSKGMSLKDCKADLSGDVKNQLEEWLSDLGNAVGPYSRATRRLFLLEDDHGTTDFSEYGGCAASP